MQKGTHYSSSLQKPQLEETPETPPSSRAEGLLFLHGLEMQVRKQQLELDMEQQTGSK